MRDSPEAESTTARRRPRSATIVTWGLVALLTWMLARLVIVLARDFWVIAIAWSQP